MTIAAKEKSTRVKPSAGQGEDRKAGIILEAAKKVFLEQGYDASSTDLIASTAGVSKATVYKRFKSKEALLIALIDHEIRTILPETLWQPGSGNLDIEASLRQIAETYLAIFLTKAGAGLHRLILGQALRHPEIGRMFYAAGPQRTHAQVAAFRKAAVEKDLLVVPDVPIAATQFLSLVRGELTLNSTFSLPFPPKEAVDALVDSSIRMFLAAYGRKSDLRR